MGVGVGVGVEVCACVCHECHMYKCMCVLKVTLCGGI